MYENHFGFAKKPFSILPDPSFLYLSRSHRMAFSMLEYGVLNQAGFTVITGEVGLGKTTLIHHLLSSSPDELIVGLVQFLPKRQSRMIDWILTAFGQPTTGRSYNQLYKTFIDFLKDTDAQNKRAVLVIDEAQNLQPAVLEELRMLSNINVSRQLFQLILVGQPELQEMIQRPEHVQFAQRISSDYILRPLPSDETSHYIDHRIITAGGVPEIFTSEAKKAIFAESNGIPRLINVISEKALVYGYATSSKVITSDIVESVVSDKRNYGI